MAKNPLQDSSAERTTTWTVGYDEAQRIVEVTYRGRTTAADIEAAATQRIAVQKQHDAARVLVHAGEMEFAASLVEVFHLPNRLYDQLDAPRDGRIAVVRPHESSAREAAAFFESACRNRGWQVRSFDEYRPAVSWLTEGPG